MHPLLSLAVVALAVIALSAVARLLFARSAADLLVAVQLAGSAFAAKLILLALAYGMTALADVALVLALLTATVAVVFAARLPADGDEDERPC
ncbi:MAG: pH regulation protein F [Geminicoccaceae bacterium]